MNQRVRAIIVDKGKIAFIERAKTTGTYYVFPGGGVEKGETDVQALEREVKEELGITVSVGELIGEYRELYASENIVHHFYLCEQTGGEFGSGNGPEYQPNSPYLATGTHDPIWIDLAKLPELSVRPPEMKDLVMKRFMP